MAWNKSRVTYPRLISKYARLISKYPRLISRYIFFNLLLHRPPMKVEVISTPMEVFRPPFNLHLRSVRPPLMDQWSSLKKKQRREEEREREEERISEGNLGRSHTLVLFLQNLLSWWYYHKTNPIWCYFSLFALHFYRKSWNSYSVFSVNNFSEKGQSTWAP